jgi:Arc/MetJ-type ribon-helix-helix transcriptional regulator
MTATVKLPAALEMHLRQHCATSGESISDVIRVALEAHLSAVSAKSATSAAALGREYFGKYAGATDLAETYRSQRSDLWGSVASDKNKRRPNG